MLEQITVLILTYNEAPNIQRTLDSLTWAKHILIIDSFSNDETLEIASRYKQVQVIQNKFVSFAQQCNFGLSKVRTEWVLSIDADYFIPEEFKTELSALKPSTYDGYEAKFKYCVFGKPLRGTLYPPRNVLYKKEKAVYEEDGHAHRVKITGETGILHQYIYHDDRKPLSRWLLSQDNYMKIEVKKIMETPREKLNLNDRIRAQKIWAPFLVFFYCLIWKRGILDGWQGWFYAFQRMLAEMLLSVRLIEQKIMDTTKY